MRALVLAVACVAAAWLACGVGAAAHTLTACDAEMTCDTCMAANGGCVWSAARGWCRSTGERTPPETEWLVRSKRNALMHRQNQCKVANAARLGYRPAPATTEQQTATRNAVNANDAAIDVAANHAHVNVPGNAVQFVAAEAGRRACIVDANSVAHLVANIHAPEQTFANLIDSVPKFRAYIEFLRTVMAVQIHVVDFTQYWRAVANTHSTAPGMNNPPPGGRFKLSAECWEDEAPGVSPVQHAGGAAPNIRNPMNCDMVTFDRAGHVLPNGLRAYAQYVRDQRDAGTASGDPAIDVFPGAVNPMAADPDLDLFYSNVAAETPACVPATQPIAGADLVTDDAQVLDGYTVSLRANNALHVDLFAPVTVSATDVTERKRLQGNAVQRILNANLARNAHCFYRLWNPTVGTDGNQKFLERLRRAMASGRRPFAPASELFLYREGTTVANQGRWARARLLGLSSDGKQVLMQIDHLGAAGHRAFLNVQRTPAQVQAAGWKLQISDLPAIGAGAVADVSDTAAGQHMAVWTNFALFDPAAPAAFGGGGNPMWPYVNVQPAAGAPHISDAVERAVMPMLYRRVANSAAWRVTPVGIITGVVAATSITTDAGVQVLQSNTFTPTTAANGLATEYYVRKLMPTVFGDNRALRLVFDSTGQCGVGARCQDDAFIAAAYDAHRLSVELLIGRQKMNAPSVSWNALPRGWMGNPWTNGFLNTQYGRRPRHTDPLGVWRVAINDARRVVLDSLAQESLVVAQYAAIKAGCGQVGNAYQHYTLREATFAEQNKDDHLMSQWFSNTVLNQIWRVATDDWTRFDFLDGEVNWGAATLGRLVPRNFGPLTKSYWLDFTVPVLWLIRNNPARAPSMADSLEAEYHAQRQSAAVDVYNLAYELLLQPKLASAARFNRDDMRALMVDLLRLTLQANFDYSALWRAQEFGTANPNSVYLYQTRATGLGNAPPSPFNRATNAQETMSVAELLVFVGRLHEITQSDRLLGLIADRYFAATEFRFADDGVGALPPPRPVARAPRSHAKRLAKLRRRLQPLQQ